MHVQNIAVSRKEGEARNLEENERTIRSLQKWRRREGLDMGLEVGEQGGLIDEAGKIQAQKTGH